MAAGSVANSDTFKATTPSDREIVLTRLFDAPRRSRVRGHDEAGAREALVGHSRRAATRSRCARLIPAGRGMAFMGKGRGQRRVRGFHGEYREMASRNASYSRRYTSRSPMPNRSSRRADRGGRQDAPDRDAPLSVQGSARHGDPERHDARRRHQLRQARGTGRELQEHSKKHYEDESDEKEDQKALSYLVFSRLRGRFWARVALCRVTTARRLACMCRPESRANAGRSWWRSARRSSRLRAAPRNRPRGRRPSRRHLGGRRRPPDQARRGRACVSLGRAAESAVSEEEALAAKPQHPRRPDRAGRAAGQGQRAQDRRYRTESTPPTPTRRRTSPTRVQEGAGPPQPDGGGHARRAAARTVVTQKLIEREVQTRSVSRPGSHRVLQHQQGEFNFPEEAYRIAQIVVTPVRDSRSRTARVTMRRRRRRRPARRRC